jgi:hypothetical protein
MVKEEEGKVRSWTETLSMLSVLCNEDFRKNEVILLRSPRQYGAIGEGSNPVAPVAGTED